MRFLRTSNQLAGHPWTTGLGALLLTMALSGCAELRPWDELRRTPSSPSSYFSPTSRPATVARTGAERVAAEPLPGSQAVDGKLSLSDCIEIGLDRNPQTRSSWESARAAAAHVGEERAAHLPALDATVQAARGESVSLDADKEGTTRDTYAGHLDLTYLLFDGGVRRAQVQAVPSAPEMVR